MIIPSNLYRISSMESNRGQSGSWFCFEEGNGGGKVESCEPYSHLHLPSLFDRILQLKRLKKYY